MKRLEQGAAGLEAEAEWKEIPEFKQHWTGRQGDPECEENTQSPPCLIYLCICPTTQHPGSGTQEKCRKHFLNEGTQGSVGEIGPFLQ